MNNFFSRISDCTAEISDTRRKRNADLKELEATCKQLVSKKTVVSIGVNPTFKVIFTPLEYIPTIPPLSSYVINVCYNTEKTKDI